MEVTKTEFYDLNGIFGWVMGEGNIQTEGKGLLRKVTIWEDGTEAAQSNPNWLDKTTGKPQYPEPV